MHYLSSKYMARKTSDVFLKTKMKEKQCFKVH